MKYVYDDPIDVSLLEGEYPDRYSQRQVIADGTEVTLRPVRPTDESALRDMFYLLSEESIYLRFPAHRRSSSCEGSPSRQHQL